MAPPTIPAAALKLIAFEIDSIPMERRLWPDRSDLRQLQDGFGAPYLNIDRSPRRRNVRTTRGRGCGT